MGEELLAKTTKQIGGGQGRKIPVSRRSRKSSEFLRVRKTTQEDMITWFNLLIINYSNHGTLLNLFLLFFFCA
jgi:hypothetical protein